MWDSIKTFAVEFVSDLFEILQDGFSWAFEQILAIVTAVADSVPVPEWSFSSAWSALPETVVQFALRVGVAEGLSIVIGALLIRLLLQAIPFVRFGS